MRKNGCCKRVIELSTIVAVMFLTACGNSSAKSEGTYMAESDITTDNAYMTDEYDIAAESKMTAAGESNEPAAEKYQETVNLSAEKISSFFSSVFFRLIQKQSSDSSITIVPTNNKILKINICLRLETGESFHTHKNNMRKANHNIRLIHRHQHHLIFTFQNLFQLA